ncbi:MAG: hypothetical protein D6762_06115 [Candidatus Neomarinimicrobiota bacterium]|nr:MAG: hypothetical protein D6762_06115 [Candidatus Neomarinimicrobiota bacterium]
MLGQRFFPVGTRRHERAFELAKRLDPVEELHPVSWYGVWALFAAGMAAHHGVINRYVYWDFTWTLYGLGGLLVWSLGLSTLLHRRGWYDPTGPLTRRTGIAEMALAVIAFLSGWGRPTGLTFIYLLGYLAAFGALRLGYAISLEERDGFKQIPASARHRAKVGGGTLLYGLAMGIGIGLDDPVLSTAAAVGLPFFLVALADAHARHVQRLQFYPLFALVGFIGMREGWFFVVSLVWFYFWRYYYYFRLGIIHPSFGVDPDEPLSQTA